MLTPSPVLVPLGRLYDPLLQLAQRVHRILGKRRKTIWADDRGRVFVNGSSLLPQISPRWIVGTYDIHVPLDVIEADLRLALRARASSWITDWNEPSSGADHGEDRRIEKRRAARPRRARVAFKEIQRLNATSSESGVASM
jgi:hypothetical protein